MGHVTRFSGTTADWRDIASDIERFHEASLSYRKRITATTNDQGFAFRKGHADYSMNLPLMICPEMSDAVDAVWHAIV